MYKLSKYTLIYAYKKEYIVYNTLTQALILINKEIKVILDNLNHSSINNETKKNLNTLYENGIIAKSKEDERKKASLWLYQLKSKTDTLTATVLTTMKCNFACTYCFENKIMDNTSLSVKDAGKIAYWLIERAKLLKSQRIKVVFYGGEPLCNTKPIEIISNILNQWAKITNQSYEFSMFTNGSLLTPDMADRLVPLGLKSVKITLDGDKDIHDKQRPFKNGKGSFDIVLKNIEACADKLKIVIGGNITEKSYKSVLRLIDILTEKGLHKKLYMVRFAPIATRLGKGCTIEPDDIFSYSETKLTEKAFQLTKKLQEKGFNIGFWLNTNTCSMLDEGNNITIDPKGNIYKCNVLVGQQEQIVGNINSQEFNAVHQKLRSFTPWQIERCKTCPFLPMCNGGCRYKAFVEKGDFFACNCRQDLYYKYMPRWVTLEYKRTLEK
ncbi:radical SAM protein [Candidatus Margulisiibacteriota bacterium]